MKKKILWLSRHETTKEQKEGLGKPVRVIRYGE